MNYRQREIQISNTDPHSAKREKSCYKGDEVDPGSAKCTKSMIFEVK
ncbi:hypothetical protein SAMN05216232_0408 [Virgibacillus subterraneus]|uniref:Uncharacterized protein n=1 Tax=Virgibacillus subterraneus TaxID=621109 RepID=A0A1H8ZEM7_9BACI|nr:hypothetical protein SAMN05216232_0408 [Virgibacillus subterraneus]